MSVVLRFLCLDPQTSSGRAARRCCLCVSALMLLAGCGSVDHGDRVPLEGTVTVGGEPLTVNATIYFNPPAGHNGIGSSGEVADGSFTIPAESGPTPGKTYEVTVITAPGIPPPDLPPEEMMKRQPKTYTTTVDIPPRGEGSQPLEIAL